MTIDAKRCTICNTPAQLKELYGFGYCPNCFRRAAEEDDEDELLECYDDLEGVLDHLLEQR